MKKTRKIMIVAGEASGDGHSAKLVRAIRETAPETEFEFFGAAGPKMRVAGVEAVVQSDGLSIVGVAEIARALPMFLRVSKELKKEAADRKPDAVILVDFPDFNLKLAKALKKQGLCVIYYISPQLWAWRKYRVSTIKKYVDLMIAILPFERDWYAKHGVTNVEYVGSPLAREVRAERSKEEFCRDHGLDPSKPIISLLPGSRHKEIARILPVLLQTASKMEKRDPEIQFVIAMASAGAGSLFGVPTLVGSSPAKKPTKVGTPNAKKLITVENETYDALNASDAAAVTSGTATLETGIIGTPMAIVYKTSPLNYALLKPLISVEHYGLINLIAGERVAKELIQNDFTCETLAAELMRLIEPNKNAAMREKLRLATDKLGQGGASKRAAKAILKLISRRV